VSYIKVNDWQLIEDIISKDAKLTETSLELSFQH